MAPLNGVTGLRCAESPIEGKYYDGRERADVVKDRRIFLEEMSALHASNTPNKVAAEVLKDVNLDTKWEDIIFWFHDESTLNTNDDQSVMWKDETMQVIKPKGRGAGLMISDYCALSDEMFSVAEVDPTVEQSARVLFEYGKGKEGYWNNDLFLKQIEKALKIAEAKYPPRAFKHVWVFDHSCGHTAYAPDALVVSRLNKKPGGKQPAMRDTTWAGKPQKLVMWTFLFQEVGIQGKTNYSLQATGATCFFEANIPQKLINEKTGHKSLDALEELTH